MKYYIIAGEASGDLHGSNLMKELYLLDKRANIRFWGGDLMQAVGGYQVKHYKKLAFMGFIEVLFNIKAILKNLEICKKDIKIFQPDVIIFVDYPGFNMRIAKWAKSKNFRTHYYILPQIWAWRENRIKAIKRDFDKLFVILPFEKLFYEKNHNYPVTFVGHPLIDAINNHIKIDERKFRSENNLDERPIIAVLPGSRKQEISKMLPIMLSVIGDFIDYQFVVAGAPSLDFLYYKHFLNHKNVKFITNKTYDLLSYSEAALVTSGTATLETALFKVPEVICYKSSWASYEIAKRVIKLKYISLVNLIMADEVVKELIQHKCNKKNIKKALENILNPSNRSKLFEQYSILESKLGGIGASKKTAKSIINDIN